MKASGGQVNSEQFQYQFREPITRSVNDNVWELCAHSDSIGYPSDDVAKRTLLPLLRRSTDMSSMSRELQISARAWPERYYLSAERSNLLRLFEWDSTASVLEVGAGCGSITRFLGETFTSVLAVEGERHRASVAAERCRDLASVHVVCSPYQALADEARFDLIFCIGVLEYAPLFEPGPSPMKAMLERLRGHLLPEGVLVLAIENKLGLKYFAGMAEDHTGIRYDGIEGYRRSARPGPTTLGKAELQDLLIESGYGSSRFFFPFPDYKFPHAIAREDALAIPSHNLVDFLNVDAGDYLPKLPPRTFNQQPVFSQLLKNGIAADLANSFLVLAATSMKSPSLDVHWDLASIRMTPRRPEFWTKSVVTGLAKGHGRVSRQRLTEGVNKQVALRSSTSISWHSESTIGRLASEKFMARSGTLTDVAEVLRPWARWLREQADPGGLVSGELLDASPYNVIVTGGGSVNFIDTEWVWADRIPARILVLRGLAMLVERSRAECMGSPSPAAQGSIWSVCSSLGRLLDLDVSDDDLRCVATLEGSFQSAVTDEVVTAVSVRQQLTRSPRVARGRLRVRRTAQSIRRRIGFLRR